MTKIPSVEERVEEFNPDNSNNSVLGRYVVALTKALSNNSFGDNEKEDEIINDWLRQALTAEREAGARQERERIKNILQRTVIDPNALSYDSRLLAASILQFKHTKEQLETALKI